MREPGTNPSTARLSTFQPTSMDAPRHDTTSQLIAMAEDAEVWQIEVNALKQRLKLTLKNSSKPRT